MRQTSPCLVLLAALVSSACGAEEPQSPEADHEAHWGYSGEAGPENWGSLNEEFATCASGTVQSPIDIKAATSKNIPDVDFNYKETALTILNNGHTIQVNCDKGSSISVDGHTYNVLQFHFHTPSENTVNGEHFPMEMHIVHADDDMNLAVVAVMFKEADANEAFAPVADHAPSEPAEAKAIPEVSMNVADLLPESTLAYHFMGSLTTPPCTEGVNWFVLRDPVAASSSQLAALHDVLGNNNRPVQPLNGRDLVADSASE